MRHLVLIALAAGTMLGGNANAASLYTDLSSWQAAAGTYTNDTSYGTAYDDITGLTLDDGTQLGFNAPLSVRQIGSSWSTWSGSYAGQILYTSGLTNLTISFDTAVNGFGLFAEPNPFSVFEFNFTLSDGSTVSASYDGNGGAGFLGFVGNGITSATVSSSIDFAVGDFYVAAAPAVPEPATWAMMIGGLGLVGASMRRRAGKVAFA